MQAAALAVPTRTMGRFTSQAPVRPYRPRAKYAILRRNRNVRAPPAARRQNLAFAVGA